MKFLVMIALCCFLTTTTWCQSELGDEPTNAKGWTLISFHRVWTPQYNNTPNSGFGVNFFFSSNAERTVWAGGTVTFSGINQRQAMMLGAGVGAWIVGTGRLGMFTYAMTGLGMGSNSAITGFNFFTDPSLSVGWASQAGVGGCIEIFKNIRIHITGMAMYFTNEQGATPYGVQAGLVFGGR